MRFLDLIRMSISNLWRRKLRTFLTVLGVVIGTASIIVMVSIGIGQNRSLMAAISESGSLTAIEVNYYPGMTTVSYNEDGSMTTEKTSEEIRLNDETLELFASIPYVTDVEPWLNVSVIMKQGVYINTYVDVYGVSQKVLQKIPLSEGSYPEKNSDTLEFLVAKESMAQNFYNEKTQKYYWDTGELPEIDFMNQAVFTIFDTDAYYQSQGGSDSSQSVAPPKKYMLQASGLVDETADNSWQYRYSIYCDIDTLKTTLKRVFRNKVIPGQPSQKNGKPYMDYTYNKAIVSVDKMEHVAEVLEQIHQMGFQAYSDAEYMESMQKQSKTTQLVLGGIGAVSLFVAAIGIANTMMMSIYERTKEIGIIKVLGCSLGNIRSMFLLEAAAIGFTGGLVGNILSYGLSALINRFAVGMMSGMYGNGSDMELSYIPPWLALAALGFAVLVGIISGFLPALRAMKLSPLAAIRNE